MVMVSLPSVPMTISATPNALSHLVLSEVLGTPASVVTFRAVAFVKPFCSLDPDGDIAHYLLTTGQPSIHPNWACYHTKLYEFTRDGIKLGIVPHVVGSSFAALVAEELFASGCQLIISETSAGQIAPIAQPPYF